MIDQEKIANISNGNLERPIACFDLETTGLDIATDRIVEIGICRIDPDKDEPELFFSRCNPGISVGKSANVHGISDADLMNEPKFCSLIPGIMKVLDSCDLLGFNVRRFDLPMLTANMRRCGVNLNIGDSRVIDAQVLFHLNEPRNLEGASEFYLNEVHHDAHTALGDAVVTARVFMAQMEKYNLSYNLDKLEAMMVEYEERSWISIDEVGDIILNRGKYNGKSLRQILRKDRGYVAWLAYKAGNIIPNRLRMEAKKSLTSINW